MNKTVKIIIFGLAAFFALLCVAQLIFYIPAVLSMLKDAVANGTDKAQITGYYKQNFFPQLFSYIISGFGVSSILFACGLIYCKKTDAAVTEAVIGEPAYEVVEEVSEEADEDESETE